MTDDSILITKPDAAQRQLRTAIRLWFSGGDPVAIHTLAAAAHEIAYVLARRAGHKGFIFDSPIVREEARKRLNKSLKDLAAFFKHARSDPDGTLAFKPRINELLMFMTGAALNLIGHPVGAESTALNWWLAIHHPNILTEPELIERIPIQLLKELRSTSKAEFLKLAEETHAHMGAL